MGNEDKIRPPIQAKFRGPGPGNYKLPPTVGYEHHDYTRLRNPAFSIGAQTGIPNKMVVPGPKYDVAKITRYGKSGVPVYSIKPKIDPLTPPRIPGPGAYAPEKIPYKTPAYSIAARNKQRRTDQTPSPNSYKLPTNLGPHIPDKEGSAAYSMGVRHKPLSGFQSPGPATYDPGSLNVCRTKAPQYSVTGPYKGVRRGQVPGPAEYKPMYNVNREEPKFSFGVKHTEYSVPCITENDNM